MSEMAVEMALICLGIYAGIGLAFAVPFLRWGAVRMDHGVEGSGVAARVILIPGVIALWPYLFLRLLSGAKFKG